MAGVRGQKPPPPGGRSVQAGTGIFGLADRFRRRVCKAAVVVGEQGPLRSLCDPVFVAQADFGHGQKADLPCDLLRTAAVCAGLRDGDRVVQKGVPEVGFEEGQEAGFGLVFVVVGPDVRVIRRGVLSVLGAVPAARAGGAVQPLKKVRHGGAVVAVTSAVAVAVVRLHCVEAFQGNNSLRHQAHAVGRLAADFEADHSAVILRVDRFHHRADGQRRQFFRHGIPPFLF